MTAAELDDAEPRLNLLCAFPYISKRLTTLIASHYGALRFIIDSGAFTAWRAGKSIKVDDYCRFLEALPFKPWRYFTLDVVGDHAATLRNYETMLKRGFKPVPIFTRGAPLRDLARYYDTSEVTAVGGLVGTPGNKGFVNGIMKHIKKRRCHWLGLTSLPFLKTYRPYMCDTASWESGAQFATFRLYMGNSRLIAVNKETFRTRPSQEILDAVESYGIDPRALAKNASWAGGYSANRTLNAASGVRLMMDVQANLGTLLFLGATTEHAITLLLRGFEQDQKRRTAA